MEKKKGIPQEKEDNVGLGLGFQLHTRQKITHKQLKPLLPLSNLIVAVLFLIPVRRRRVSKVAYCTCVIVL